MGRNEEADERCSLELRQCGEAGEHDGRADDLLRKDTRTARTGQGQEQEQDKDRTRTEAQMEAWTRTAAIA